MFGNVPRPVWEKWVSPDGLGRIELACRAMLVRAGDKLILCETGIGNFFDPAMADRFGVSEKDHRLLANLAAAGVHPDDIDFVILSHLHFDHAGGLLPSFADIQSGNRELLFRNARYVTGKAGFERARNPHSRDRASFIPGMTDQLIASGRLILVDRDTHGATSHEDVLPEFLSFRFTDGHTPGQMHTVVTGTSGTMIFAGDLVPGRAWVHVPVSMGYDRFPELVINEKEDLYRVAVPERWWVFYTHDAQCAASRIESAQDGSRMKIKPCEEQPVLNSFVL
jgi:glyoxylase-like metal-dependent hydrolase (beta-lactamase superfamily II)